MLECGEVFRKKYHKKYLIQTFVICGSNWYTEPYTTRRLIGNTMNEKQALKSMWKSVNNLFEWGYLKVNYIE